MSKRKLKKELIDGRRVEVYRNLHKDCWSVRHKGIVIAHAQTVLIDEPEFVVSQRGRERVLQEKRKNVHAFVRGALRGIDGDLGRLESHVKYNPYRHGHFYNQEDELPVMLAEKAHMHEDFAVTIN